MEEKVKLFLLLFRCIIIYSGIDGICPNYTVTGADSYSSNYATKRALVYCTAIIIIFFVVLSTILIYII